MFQVKINLLPGQIVDYVISGDDDPAIRRAAQRMNAAAFFRKPVDGSALLDAIDWAVRWNLANGHAEEMDNDEGSEQGLKSLFESHRGDES